MTSTKSVPLSAIYEELWSRHDLSWLLYDYQIPVYDAIKKAMDNEDLKFVLNISRRFGKTSVLVVIAIELALATQDRQIRFAAPTGKDLRKAVIPIVNLLTQTAPDKLKPVFNSQSNEFHFKNGSGIHLAGVNKNQSNNLRGTVSHLNIIDEAGQVDDLSYLIQSVLLPQTLTTGGLTIISSTPSLSPDHAFHQYYIQAKNDGKLSQFNIYDNTKLDKDKITRIMNDNGGADSTTWRREYMVEFCVDSELNIIPEWKTSYEKALDHSEYYPFYHHYDSMDIGVVDKTAILYGTYLFDKGIMYIEGESIINGSDMTTEVINTNIINKEQQLWGNSDVYRRIADNNNLLLLNDLNKLHGTYFMPTNKDTLDAMINVVRMFVAQGRLIVNPICTELIGCLNNGIWTKSSTNRKFARSQTYGHYDALASLVYLIRNLDTNTNPIPVGHNLDISTHYIRGNIEQSQDNITCLKQVFNLQDN